MLRTLNKEENIGIDMQIIFNININVLTKATSQQLANKVHFRVLRHLKDRAAQRSFPTLVKVVLVQRLCTISLLRMAHTGHQGAGDNTGCDVDTAHWRYCGSLTS